MTSRSPRGRCIAIEAHPRAPRLALIVLLAGLSLSAGCGLMGRELDAHRALAHLQFSVQDAADSEDAEAALEATRGELAALRGRDPLVAALWEASVALSASPEKALALAERGLAFHPHHTPLLIMQLQLLAAQGHVGELIHAARRALAIGQPSLNQALLHQALVDAQLQSDAPDAARAEVLVFGALPEAPRPRVAELMARVALTYAVLGQPGAADAAFDQSLAAGPEGPARLLNDVARLPARRDAALELVRRALERHPRHPDLQLYVIVEDMERGRLEPAAAGLARLPEGLPPRLEGQAGMLAARLDLLQDRPDAALAAVRARLAGSASDPHALLVLMELKERFDQPADDEFQALLSAAAQHPRGLPSALQQRLQAFVPPEPPAP